MAKIRLATENDASAIVSIYAPYVRETAISFEEVPPTTSEIRERMRKTLSTHPFLVCQEDDDVIAYAYASPHKERASYRWSVDVAVYVAQSAHRRGVGRALYTRLLEILARQGFHAAFAGITLPNAKSVGLHEAMGFQPVGIYTEVGFKLGAWRDVGWWRLRLSDGPPGSEPVPFLDLPTS